MIPRLRSKHTKIASFEADVTGYELLGSEVLLYFKVAGHKHDCKS